VYGWGVLSGGGGVFHVWNDYNLIGLVEESIYQKIKKFLWDREGMKARGGGEGDKKTEGMKMGGHRENFLI